MRDFLKNFKTDFELNDENNSITLTYDCGSSEDSESFLNKAEDASKDFDIKICGYILDNVEDELDNEDKIWTIVEIEVFCGDFNTVNRENLKNFIEFLDTI